MSDKESKVIEQPEDNNAINTYSSRLGISFNDLKNGNISSLPKVAIAKIHNGLVCYLLNFSKVHQSTSKKKWAI